MHGRRLVGSQIPTIRRLSTFFAALLVAGLATASTAHALVYFVDQDGNLGRANVQTGKVQPKFKTGFTFRPSDDASLIESDGQFLYSVHMDRSGPILQRVGVDGSNRQILYHLLSFKVTDIEVSGGWVYVQYFTGDGNQTFVWANRLRAAAAAWTRRGLRR